MDEEQLRRDAAQGALVPGIYVCDDAGGAWMPIENSPLASLVRDPAASRRSAFQTIQMAFGIGVLLWGAYSWYSCSRAVGKDRDAATNVAAAPPPVTPRPAHLQLSERHRAEVLAFLNWVSKARFHPRDAGSGKTECAIEAYTTGARCQSIYWGDAGAPSYFIAFSEADPAAVMFNASFMGAQFDCGLLADAEVIRRWRYASASKMRCSLEAGGLKDLELVVEQYPDNTKLLVYSPRYLDFNSAFAEVALTQGL